MKPTAWIPAFLLFASSLSSPAPGHGWGDHNCLSDADATFLVDILVSLSVKFDPAYVTQYLTDDFTLQSDSIVSTRAFSCLDETVHAMTQWRDVS